MPFLIQFSHGMDREHLIFLHQTKFGWNISTPIDNVFVLWRTEEMKHMQAARDSPEM